MTVRTDTIDIFKDGLLIEDQSLLQKLMSGVGQNINQGMPLIESIKKFGIDQALQMTGLDPRIQQDIKMQIPNDEIAANFILPRILEKYSLPSSVKDILLKGNVSMQRRIPLSDKTTFTAGTNIDKTGRATGNLGVRYQPSKTGFIEAGARLDSKRSPEFQISFGRKFAQGGIATL